MPVDIWMHGTLTARARLTSARRKVVLEYTDEARSRYRGGAPILSCSLPATLGPTAPAATQAFLEGLLPEGRALETAASRLRGVELDSSGAPAAPSDAVALLAEYGRECAGAVVVVPTGDAPPADGHPSPPLSDVELADLIRSLPTKPLGADPGREIRMSLGGAQDKLLLTRVSGRWCTPISGYPSTHILKPTTVWPHSAENEAVVLALSRACGLSSNEVWVERIGDTSVLVAERYDRVLADDGTIHRLHQEDMCQAAGVRPKDKYLIGRPSDRMARVLREFTASPIRETLAIYRQVAFRALIGDEDGHGKNYSLIHAESSVTAAPLYDSLCTLAYPDLSGTMGTPIGAQRSLAKVDRQALADEARAMGIPADAATQAIEELVDNVRSGVATLEPALTEGWPAEPIIETILARARRLESGQPLGGAGSTRPRRRTLDAATEQKRPAPTRRASNSPN